MKKNYINKLLLLVVVFTSITISAQQGPILYDFSADTQNWVKGYGTGVIGHDPTAGVSSDGALTLDRTDGAGSATNNNANIRRGQGGDDAFIVLNADVYNYIKLVILNETESVNIRVAGLSRAAGATGEGVAFTAINLNGVIKAKDGSNYQTVYLDISEITGEITRLDLLFRADSALTDPTGAKVIIDEIEFLSEAPSTDTFSGFIKNPSFDDPGATYTFKGNTGQLGREISTDYAKDGTQSFKSTFAKNQDAQFWYFNNFVQSFDSGVITDSKQAKVTMWVRSARTSPIGIIVRLKTTNASGANVKNSGWPTAIVSTSGTADTWEQLTFEIPLPFDHTDVATEVRNIEMWIGYDYDSENPTAAEHGVAGDVLYFDQMTSGIEDAPTASVNSQLLEGISIYPNPVENNLFIKSKDAIQSAEVFNLLGTKVLSLNNVQGSLDVSSLSKSIYILKLTSDKGISTKRFVKK